MLKKVYVTYFNPFVHKNLSNSVIYVVRITKTSVHIDNEEYYFYANSKPCEECIKKMLQCGIKKVVYSTENGFVSSKVSDLVGVKTSGYKYLEKLNSDDQKIKTKK